MTLRRLIPYVVVFLILAVAYGGLRWGKERQMARDEEAKKVFALKEGDLSDLTLVRGEDEVRLVKKDQIWRITAPVDAQADQVSAVEFDAVIVPGGYAPDIMRRSEKLLAVTRAIHDAGKPVAFICHAGWVPISAGIVRGRKVTSVKAIKDDLVNAGATWLDESVVVDGNLISSRTPADLPHFCKALIAALRG